MRTTFRLLFFGLLFPTLSWAKTAEIQIRFSHQDDQILFMEEDKRVSQGERAREFYERLGPARFRPTLLETMDMLGIEESPSRYLSHIEVDETPSGLSLHLSEPTPSIAQRFFKFFIDALIVAEYEAGKAIWEKEIEEVDQGMARLEARLDKGGLSTEEEVAINDSLLTLSRKNFNIGFQIEMKLTLKVLYPAHIVV